MRSWGQRSSQDEQRSQSKADKSLKLAFRHEIRPDEYLFRIWVTAVISSGFFIFVAAAKYGHFDLNLLLPLNGSWKAHDPAGGLYLETWSNIIVNSLQVGFSIWGAVLIILGVIRIFGSHKYVFACFYLGMAFLGFVMVLPNWTEILLKMLIAKCPILVH